LDSQKVVGVRQIDYEDEDDGGDGWRRISSPIKALNILNYAPSVHHAFESKDKAHLIRSNR